MRDLHTTSPTDIDIHAVAGRVVTQLQQGRHLEALQLLERERASEPLAVQEVVDRDVAVGARAELEQLRGSGVLRGEPGWALALERLQQATRPPRIPAYDGRNPDAPNELAGLSDAQVYDVYASMVASRGSQAASDALEAGDSVLIGLRRETSTLASMDAHGRRGTGVYDDHIVVLRKDSNGEHLWFIADRASTEPTAQYDHHSGSDGRRRTSAGRYVDRLDAAPGYEDVRRRKIEGEDVNADSVGDLGRLGEGTIEMSRTTHPARGNPRDFSLRPTPEQSRSPRNADLIQRDTNADGWFTQSDVNGVQALNDSFKIHSGSIRNTDSAGCQTMHPADYDQFIRAVRRNQAQTRWQYVLTSTEGGPFHNVDSHIESDDLRPGSQTPAADLQEPAWDQQGPPSPGQSKDSSQASITFFDRYYAAVVAGDTMEADGSRWSSRAHLVGNF